MADNCYYYIVSKYFCSTEIQPKCKFPSHLQGISNAKLAIKSRTDLKLGTEVTVTCFDGYVNSIKKVNAEFINLRLGSKWKAPACGFVEGT